MSDTKGKGGESSLSRRMKEEFRHAGASQLRQGGEEQESPTSYAEDKAERVADRIVSETGSGAVRAVESGRQLFVDHLRTKGIRLIPFLPLPGYPFHYTP